MAILMPALQRARKQTRAVACLSNLRHWGFIFNMYTDDNDHKFYGAWSTSQQGHVWIGALKPYYQDEDINFCPSASKPNADNGLWGEAFEAYGVFPADDGRYGYAGLAGSYGINGYCLIPNGVDTYESGVAVSQGWKTAGERGAGNVPWFSEALRFDLWPVSTDAPAASEFAAWSGNLMARTCINRHQGFENVAFLDFSVRRVGLKELWTLKWHKSFDINGPWTQAGGVVGSDWPDWIRRFQDY